MAAKDSKTGDSSQAAAPDDGDQAAAAAAAVELPPFHGLEPAWIREALTSILARLDKLEGSHKRGG